MTYIFNGGITGIFSYYLKTKLKWHRTITEFAYFLVRNFDKVPHQRLLIKLKSYGITDDLLKWIEKFLCNSKQRVGVNGKLSKWFKVMSGIPQGSILGPIWFLIYINDLSESCDINGCDANIYLYADDAKLYKVRR